MTYLLETRLVPSHYSAPILGLRPFDPEPRSPGCLAPRLLERVKDHIESNIDCTLSMPELAKLVGLSTSHFARCFRKSVGLPPHTYVKQRRVARARDLLSETKLPVAEIALVLGFSDQSHFTRRFREIMGLPPGAYRLSCAT
jgi:transcriptional regulator GlxA family with amidase domain